VTNWLPDDFAAAHLKPPGPHRSDMPGLLRKLVIIAAVDGLILHGNGANGLRSNHNGSNNEASSIRIDYKTNKITALPASSESLEGQDVLEAYGLVGKLALLRG
jgi:hypothetical protein